MEQLKSKNDLDRFIDLYELYVYIITTSKDDKTYRNFCIFLLENYYNIKGLKFEDIADINWVIFKNISKPAIDNLFDYKVLDVMSLYDKDVNVIVIAILMSLLAIERRDEEFLLDIVRHTCLAVYCNNGDERKEELELLWVKHIETHVFKIVDFILSYINSNDIIDNYGRLFPIFTIAAGDSSLIVYTLRKEDIDNVLAKGK